nr:endoglucanase 25-like [Tanacetum cinerariifolium]
VGKGDTSGGLDDPINHSCWMKPEYIDYERPLTKCSNFYNHAAEAAALAYASIDFEDNNVYSKKFVHGATTLSTLSNKFHPYLEDMMYPLEERDPFAVAGLGRALVVPAELSFSAGCVSDIWWGIVEMIVSAMSSMMSCVGDPVRSSHGASCLFIFICFVMEEMTIDINNVALDRYWHYVLFSISNKSLEVSVCIVKIASNGVAGEVCGVERACWWLEVGGYDGVILSNATKEDSQFARRMGVLLQEMESAYDERANFIKELKVVPGVDAAVKTAEFLNDALWKDERRLQRLCKLRMDADLMAYEKEKLPRSFNVLYSEPQFILCCRREITDDLRLHVPDKMAEFMKQGQGKDISNLMKLQILRRDFEMRAQEKGIFIEKLKGNLNF